MESKGRGRGRGGRGGHGGGGRTVQVSKTLSWLLRHGAQEMGLNIRKDGYVTIDDLLNCPNVKKIKTSFEEIQKVVDENDKKRF